MRSTRGHLLGRRYQITVAIMQQRLPIAVPLVHLGMIATLLRVHPPEMTAAVWIRSGRTCRVAVIKEVAIAQQGLPRARPFVYKAPGQPAKLRLDARPIAHFHVHPCVWVCVLVLLQAIAALRSHLCTCPEQSCQGQLKHHHIVRHLPRVSDERESSGASSICLPCTTSPHEVHAARTLLQVKLQPARHMQ